MQMNQECPWNAIERCVICRERIKSRDLAEMYDPNQLYLAELSSDSTLDDVGGFVHAECGLASGWEIA